MDGSLPQTGSGIMPDWFEAFMDDQISAIGDQDPEAWIAANAERFRVEWAIHRLECLGD